MIQPLQPEDFAARCPQCGEDMWAKRGGQWTLKTAILKLSDSGRLIARCAQQGCRGQVLVPWLMVHGSPPAPKKRVIVRRFQVGQAE